MENGFIKIFRKIKDWEWYTNDTTFRVFFHLLLCANWESKIYRGVEIKRGQVVKKQEDIALELKITDRKGKPRRQPIRSALNNLKSTNDITIEKSPIGSIITINNYNDYQDQTTKKTNKNEKINQQPNHQSNQTINKEEKEEKNNIYILYIPTQEEIIKQLAFYDLPGDKLLNYTTEFQNFYIKHGAKLKKDWQELLRDWMNNLKKIKERQSGI